VLPSAKALEVAQDRINEKTLFRELGIPTTEFEPVGGRDDLDAAVKKIGLPAILKTCRMGYDGKGQWHLRTPDDVARAKSELPTATTQSASNGIPYILEKFVPFTRELSVIAVRARTGETAVYPLVENHHRGGILRLSIAPAPHLDPSIQRSAEQAARAVFDELEYVGVLAIEFFEQAGKLLANEMAPRVHNSGHWTIEGALTSQFENHLRAVVGLPLGSTLPIGCSAMLNLIGETPDAAEVLAVRDAHLHLYGKSPRAGRKLGHVTLRASSSEQLASRLSELSSFFHRPEYCLDAVLSRPASIRA
jgi:5-(carboxyamino)imidazole ribonucleotide synthase